MSTYLLEFIYIACSQCPLSPPLSLYAPFNPGIEWGLSRTPLTGVMVGHGSLEGVGGVITSEVCHLKADISVIPEMQLF